MQRTGPLHLASTWQKLEPLAYAAVLMERLSCYWLLRRTTSAQEDNQFIAKCEDGMDRQRLSTMHVAGGASAS